MDQDEYEALKKERRRLQGSVNYWTLHVKGWTTNVTKHASHENRKASAQRQLDYAKQRLAESTAKHTQISAQLHALDPEGAQQRQLHSAYNYLAQARTELAKADKLASQQTKPQAIAYWHTRVAKLRDTVSKYDQRAKDMRAAIASDRNKHIDQARAKAEQEHLAIVSEVYTSTADEAKQLRVEYEKRYGPYQQKNGPTGH